VVDGMKEFDSCHAWWWWLNQG